MKRPGKACEAAITLVELLLSLGCAMLVLAAVISAGVTLQRSCAAAEGYSTAEANQMRMLDYIALDSRRCYNAAVTTDGNGISTLTLTVPSLYDANGNLVNPFLDSHGVFGYGNPPATSTIKYYLEWKNGVLTGNFIREIVGISTTAIATNVSAFTVTPQSQNSSVKCSITFLPKFASSGTNNTTGTTVYCNTFLRNARARM
jgi:hypothetical protein